MQVQAQLFKHVITKNFGLNGFIPGSRVSCNRSNQSRHWKLRQHGFDSLISDTSCGKDSQWKRTRWKDNEEEEGLLHGGSAQSPPAVDAPLLSLSWLAEDRMIFKTIHRVSVNRH